MMSDLESLPVNERDAMISQVMRFLLSRGYKIYAPNNWPVGSVTSGSSIRPMRDPYDKGDPTDGADVA